jgi:uncharacterized OsmC-like protein
MAERRADWTAEPERAVVTVKGTSKLAGNTGARPTTMGNSSIVSDSAPGLAGHALGPTAPEMLMGALASCLLHTYVIQAVLLNIPLDHVEVEVEGKIDMAPVIGMASNAPPMIGEIVYTAHVESPAGAEAIERMHAAVEANCPVLNALRYPADVRRRTNTPQPM